ncbi:MAG: AAA family ATPase [Hydrogenophaga sp.]|nr:AAA family ATPase [Hydrogenophaga sp.]MDP3324785.1 AAA family ATPase [Hydrogenophaga sp.]
MLVGLFIRHYKIYKNINFIPISTGSGFSAFLGANGIGKSSILDALDKFFNGGDWSINAHAKSEGGISTEDKLPYIVPVFCIPKEELSGPHSDAADLLSAYLWETKLKTTETLSAFYELREKLKEYNFTKDTHYLIAIGKQFNKGNAYLGSYDKDPELRLTLDTFGIAQKQLDELLAKISNHYSYLYIPVEADPTTFSKLESTHIQKLMDEDIRGKIQTAISQKTVGTINASLQSFITDISSSLKDYKYKGTHKDKLTMNDLVEKVFEAYFTIKILHKTNGNSSIPIRDLSAGEKRRALIDLTYSLLARSATRSQRVILAIDEPDASLHVAACHDQFSRLSEIPELTIPQTQLLITTHWYGFLPIIQNGIAHSLSEGKDRIDFFSFDLLNFREQIKHANKASKGEKPRDIELKSYNDMVQSIVSSMVRTPGYNWILCEGLSDKIYLDFYLSDLVKTQNLRIIPLGGFKEPESVTSNAATGQCKFNRCSIR